MRALALTLASSLLLLLVYSPGAAAITVTLDGKCGANEHEAANGVCKCNEGYHRHWWTKKCVESRDPPSQGCRPTCL